MAIQYEGGGFVRRGLLGELFFQIPLDKTKQVSKL